MCLRWIGESEEGKWLLWGGGPQTDLLSLTRHSQQAPFTSVCSWLTCHRDAAAQGCGAQAQGTGGAAQAGGHRASPDADDGEHGVEGECVLE